VGVKYAWRGAAVYSKAPWQEWITAIAQEVIIVYINPISRSRVTRLAWSWFRHPMKSREFPAKQERLITADELLRYSF
jgi:hypothetical protein